MIDTTPDSKPFELATVGTILEVWRQKLCGFVADVVTLERAVDLICDGYFDGHDVLFNGIPGKSLLRHTKQRSV